MKKLIIFLSIIVFISCRDESIKTPIVNVIIPINQDTFKQIKIKCDNNQTEVITIYVIDSCEYLGFLGGINNNYLTHKGNCKHCQINK